MLFGCSIFRAISRLLEFSSMIITILGLNIILADFGISIYENVNYGFLAHCGTKCMGSKALEQMTL